MERTRARGARRGRVSARTERLARGCSRRGGVPSRAALGRGWEIASLAPRRSCERAGLSRRLRERRVRPHGAARRNGRAALAARGSQARAARDRTLRRRRAWWLLSRRADGDPRVPRTKELQDTPIPSGNSMLALVLLKLSRIWGDDELERRAVSVFRLVEPALQRAPARSHGRSAVSTSGSARRGRSRSSAAVDSPVARAALAPFQPNTVVALGPSDEVPLLAGKALR